MRKMLNWMTILPFLLSKGPAAAQSNGAGTASVQTDTAWVRADTAWPRADTAWTRAESFVDTIAHVIVDSSFSRYYLFATADPCSFVKFDYEDWRKYALMEDVPIYTLNELAEKAYHDRKPLGWEQPALARAICVGKAKADSMLNPLTGLDTTLTAHHRKAQTRILEEKWAHLPAEQRVVFYFSRPVFTADWQFAIIDLGYRCDSRLCGVGTTCLFRRIADGWKLIGRKVNWGG